MKKQPLPPKPREVLSLRPGYAAVLAEVLAKAGTEPFLTGLLWPTDLNLTDSHSEEESRLKPRLRINNKPSIVTRLHGLGLLVHAPVPDTDYIGYKVSAAGLAFAREHGLLPEGMQ